MRALRLGSYSIAATFAGTPSLSRGKSTTRTPFLCPPPTLGVGLRERLLRAVLGDLGEVGHRLEPAAGTRRLALANRHRQLPKISMRSPSASDTTARFWSARLPQPPVRRLRLRFPPRVSVLTLVTRTPKIDSIACLISILLESGATTNV